MRAKEARTKQMDYSDFVLVDTGSTREEKLMSMYYNNQSKNSRPFHFSLVDKSQKVPLCQFIHTFVQCFFFFRLLFTSCRLLKKYIFFLVNVGDGITIYFLC